ncbi:jasmonate-induced oxygenase 4 [Spinacia oleracea]|uniref:Jasmonate-induced oxygenase 4 n=1 Tax=Spinacia oleracea TaxID=3562 RepID=A0A9R0J565_SPIOL|nr:jasmonate-induced oxygenase 4-like [Spinacia oleracea]
MQVAPEIPSKPVQDILASTSEDVPDIFTRDAGKLSLAADSTTLPWMDCPIIDFSLLSSPDAVEAKEELTKLSYALVSWGSFQVMNHGITDSLMDGVREVSKEFFILPAEERKKYLRAANDPEGYGNDTVMSQNVPHNWNDRLYLNVFPEDQRKLGFWPQIPSNFRGTLHEFTMKVKQVNETLVQAMARCLGLEDNSFLEEYGDSVRVTARINFYPKCPFPELVHASRTHSDASAITILLQDKQVEGLQVLKDDNWFKVPIIPSALFVNVGDQMEIMSNGIFKSAVHRVVANSERERLSLAMFCSPDHEKEIGPLNKLVNENQPRLYKTIKTYGEIFFRYHPKGERPITAMRI